ncbi:hypothetical protein [Sphingomicrobium clamense]|uniref:Uncharacterized protein n=1 Tax=Sphingomicrobium clamense TaxID=2851013 RepID=A0ABS6V746_9SPHN|nr:hypothetical protein [Sphingomicrobium sp. B8]MBW0145393.1 hypothetical protein [Sphingomicrobium sp. B8]
MNPSILNVLAQTRGAALDYEGVWEARYQRWLLEPLDAETTEIASDAATFDMESLADQFDRDYVEGHLDPNERLRAQSRMAERQGDLSEAVRLRFEALPKEPGSLRSYNLTRLGMMRNAVGLKDPAIPSPGRAMAHTILAGELPSAEEMDRAGIWDIDFFMTWRLSRTTAKLMADEGRYEELLSIFDKFFNGPDDFRGKLATSYHGGLRKLVSIAPYLVIALREEGRAEEADRMIELAIAEARASERHGRIPEFAHVEAARIHAVARDRARAVRHLEQAIEGDWHLSFPQDLFPGGRDASSDSALTLLRGHPVIARFDRQLNGWRDRERPQVKAIFDVWDERIANDVYH